MKPEASGTFKHVLSRRHSRREALVFVVLIQVVMWGFSSSEAKVEAESGRVRLMWIGDVDALPTGRYVASVIKSDPRIRFTQTILAGASADEAAARRNVRLHFPRTRERLVSTTDVVMYTDAPPWILTDFQQLWIHDSIRDDGVGLLLGQMGWHTCHYAYWSCNCPADWMNTQLYEAWPMDVFPEVLIKYHTTMGTTSPLAPYMVIVERTPVVDLPDFEKQPFGGVMIGLERARPGTKVHTKWLGGKEDAITSRNYGEGITMSEPVGWDAVNPAVAKGWKYFVDFVLNHLYYVADIPVPDDPEIAHALRNAMVEFAEQKAMMLSLLDFVDKFGANTIPLHQSLDSLEVQRDSASRLYMQGEYLQSLEGMRAVLDGLMEISSESTKLRRRALLWVYATEWLVVSGTSMVCGSIVWMLMVRRRYYREVGATRLRGLHEPE